MKADSNSSSIPPLTLTGVPELLAAGKALGAPIKDIPGVRPSVLVPDGYKVEPLPHAELPPLLDHVKQAATFVDAESFILYVKRWKRTETVLLAQLPNASGKAAKFTAIFDYHVGGQGEDPKAARCAHVANYPCPVSEEWAIWSAINGKPQAQKAFIDFIDANAPDVVSPESAALLEMEGGTGIVVMNGSVD